MHKEREEKINLTCKMRNNKVSLPNPNPPPNQYRYIKGKKEINRTYPGSVQYLTSIGVN